ncbi:MAG TPA: LLM class F420-dependent oxidoreductase [Acidimicrobiales bacterium]|nr:LLM class F420-dependent oxidoreductase [Acidimicrobiales bacterium]
MRLRIFTEPQMGASYDDQLAMAQLAEECGFDAFFRSDHYVAFHGDGLPGPTDSWVTLAGLARETSRIRLGTLVSSCTFRWPGLLAISVAQVDVMSGGRAELGLGTGWFDGEHQACAVPFPPLGDRFEQLEEQLDIVTGMWTAPVGEHFNYDGRHYQVTDSPGLPKPVQSPRPPIIIGGAGPRRTPRLAARYADECNVPFHRVEDTGAQFRRVEAACEAAGRDPASLVLSAAQVVCCGRDESEFERRAAAIGRQPAELRENGAAGTPAEVIERCRRLEAVGASTVYFQVLDLADHDHVRLLASDVLPALTG